MVEIRRRLMAILSMFHLEGETAEDAQRELRLVFSKAKMLDLSVTERLVMELQL